MNNQEFRSLCNLIKTVPAGPQLKEIIRLVNERIEAENAKAEPKKSVGLNTRNAC